MILGRPGWRDERVDDSPGVSWATGPSATLSTVPIASIALDFDPILRLGDVTIRWQTAALAAVILAGLVMAAVAARRARFWSDDLLFVVVGAVPGAVVGGRLGYVLANVEFYQAHPAAIVDPAQGAMTLALAVVGGVLTSAIVAHLLGTPIRGWLQIAAIPLLVTIGLGKLAMALGGSGQGLPADVDWATAYLGPGPWGSLAPEIPSHPSQLYEGIVALLVAAVLAAAFVLGLFKGRTGRAFLAGVALWSAGRALVGSTWRGAEAVGPLRVEQVVAIGLAAVCLLLLLAPLTPVVVDETRPGRRGRSPEWPDPATRPRF